MKRHYVILLICLASCIGAQAVDYPLYMSSSKRTKTHQSGIYSSSAGLSPIGSSGPSLSPPSIASTPVGSTSFWGHTTLPQSTIYTPFSNYAPTLRGGPGDGHGGGTKIDEPTIEPLPNGLWELLILAMAYALMAFRKHVNKKKNA